MTDVPFCDDCPATVAVADLTGRVIAVEHEHRDFRQEILARIETLSAQVGETGAHSLAASRKLLELVADTDASIKDMRREIVHAMERAEKSGVDRAKKKAAKRC